jgi:hypothetical protein
VGRLRWIAALALGLAACGSGRRDAAPLDVSADADGGVEVVARCFEGFVAVEEELRLPPPPAGCEQTPAIRWTGRADVRLREEAHPTGGWLLPRHRLVLVRADWEIAQSGLERRCVEPEPAPDLAARTSRRTARVVRDFAASGRFEPDEPPVAGLLYQPQEPAVSPSGRPLPAPPPSPDKFRPGQYELDLPDPCRSLEAEGWREEEGARLPAPQIVRCNFASPLLQRFTPGRSVGDDAHACADEPRFALDEGARLQGERACESRALDGRSSRLAAEWDLRRVACDAAPGF